MCSGSVSNAHCCTTAGVSYIATARLTLSHFVEVASEVLQGTEEAVSWRDQVGSVTAALQMLKEMQTIEGKACMKSMAK